MNFQSYYSLVWMKYYFTINHSVILQMIAVKMDGNGKWNWEKYGGWERI